MAGIVHPRRDLVDDDRLLAALGGRRTSRPRARRHSRAPRRSSRRSRSPRARCRSRPRPGRGVMSRMWSRWCCRRDRRRQSAPSAVRAATTETSRSKATKPSRMHGAPPQRPPGVRGRRLGPDHDLALAVIAEAAGLQDRRPADLARAPSARSASPSTARNGAVAMPSPATKFFSAKPVLRRRQRLGARPQRRSAAEDRGGRGGGTFSNS